MVSPLSYLLSCGLSLAGASQPSFRCFQRKQFHVLVVDSQCSWEEVRTWPSDVSILNQNLISHFVVGVFGGGAGVCVHVRVCVHVHVCLLLPVSCGADAVVVVYCFLPPLVITWTRATGRQIRIRSSGEQCATREFVSTIFYFVLAAVSSHLCKPKWGTLLGLQIFWERCWRGLNSEFKPRLAHSLCQPKHVSVSRIMGMLPHMAHYIGDIKNAVHHSN